VIRCFTSQYKGINNRLTNQVRIGAAIANIATVRKIGNYTTFGYLAAWDTGATNSMINHKVAQDCGLNPIGIMDISTAGGIIEKRNVYFVSIWLPNKVCLPQVKVVEANLSHGVDLLIGMDVINMGDFTVTNFNNVTTFSFRMPSLECVDYVKILQDASAPKPDPKSLPCPCGSGKDFADCHGRKTKRGQRKSAQPST
jgi:hypothetical protein